MRKDKKIPVRKRLRTIKHHSKLGAEAGTIAAHSELANDMQMRVLAFNAHEVIALEITNVDEIKSYMRKYPMIWVQIIGLGNVNNLRKITELFKINALAMEDIVNVHQRSKLEEYDGTYFAVARIPEIIDAQLTLQQLSVFWGKKFLLTFQEKDSSCFEQLVSRINQSEKRVPMLKSAFLSYAVFDAVVDRYFPILEEYGRGVDELEEFAIDNPSTWVIRHIHDIKHDLHALRRSIWEQRDAITSFKRIAERDKNLWFYIRDCEDHTIQLLDVIESYRERSSGLMDIYLASVNNRTNKIVKQLTMIATFFMPIGVFAGIYGMNFDIEQPWNMPELGWRYGYEYFWGVVVIFIISLFYWFYKKGWFEH